MRRLQAVLTGALRAAGPASGAEVLDLGAGQQLFALRDGIARPPASLEKLYTSVALIAKLGPATRFQTAVLGTGSLRPHGVWHGDLYLRGGGDPTFGDETFNRVWEMGYGPTASELATQLLARGIRRVTGRVIGDASIFDSLRGGAATGYAPDIPDMGGQLSALTYDHGSAVPGLSPGAFAARELALTLRAMHLGAIATPRTAPTPPGAKLLASVASPPVSVLLRLMNVPSDDLFAELLTKQLGARFAGQGSIAAGAGVTSSVIAGYGLSPRIDDGSGLARSDRSSPHQVVELLKDVWHTPLGDLLSASLPVVGVEGTVKTIATRTAAQGNCVAKTGTLDNVTNLAGYCHSQGHHTLAFALLVDGPPNVRALPLESRMIAAIARY